MTEIYTNAFKQLYSQEIVPLSPGVIVNDKPQMCLALSMAHELYRRMRKPEEVSQHIYDIINNSSKDDIITIFVENGFDPDFANDMMKYNDTQELSIRKLNCLSKLEELKENKNV